MVSLAHIGVAGSFGALVGWLVVVARGLYLAIHLFTLLPKDPKRKSLQLTKNYSDTRIGMRYLFLPIFEILRKKNMSIATFSSKN